jgi:hypothetical protein
MAECEYFNEKNLMTPGRQPMGQRQMGAPLRSKILWCSHKHSPIDQETAMTMSHGQDLTCEGSLLKCLLTKAQFEDA